MLTFHPVSLSDRPWIHEILYAAGRKGCEYSFANLYFWLQRHGGVCKVGDFLCYESHYGGHLSYFFPAGVGDVYPVLQKLRKDAAERGEAFVLRGVTEEDKELLERLYPGKFRYTAHRDAFDYMYPVEKLANLAGKKLQSKRNHINRFLAENPDWHTEPITGETTALCRELAEDWYKNHEGSDALNTERSALFTALEKYEELGMEGILLRVGDRVVAFSMGNRISRETYDVNFEKAYADIQGAYPLVNREFARMIEAKYPEVRWLNREDDLGLEGLRKAKESYHPDLLVKMVARWED